MVSKVLNRFSHVFCWLNAGNNSKHNVFVIFYVVILKITKILNFKLFAAFSQLGHDLKIICMKILYKITTYWAWNIAKS